MSLLNSAGIHSAWCECMSVAMPSIRYLRRVPPVHLARISGMSRAYLDARESRQHSELLPMHTFHPERERFGQARVREVPRRL